eukprot:218631_1
MQHFVDSNKDDIYYYVINSIQSNIKSFGIKYETLFNGQHIKIFCSQCILVRKLVKHCRYKTNGCNNCDISEICENHGLELCNICKERKLLIGCGLCKLSICRKCWNKNKDNEVWKCMINCKCGWKHCATCMENKVCNSKLENISLYSSISYRSCRMITKCCKKTW